MKNIFVTNLLLFLAINLCSAQNNASDSKISVLPFDKVEASMGINITLTEEKDEFIDINIKNGVESDVIYEVKGKTLFVKMKNRIGKGVIVNVTVHYKQLTAVTASMGASVDNIGTLYADQLKLAVSSDANITLLVDSKSIDASSTAGRITISGDTEYQEIVANTGGKYLAAELLSKQALAKSSTGGTVEINVTDKVESKASFGGTILISGNPKSTTWEENLGGKVSPH